ncbi:hypothetical protein K474DRAFT_1675491 [Panus rudis PR-1116 ss-1]|nr:hypothetical protein K474DRAFT_1675491 [Panus rudis PR-1116 ss-1]
MSECYGNTRRGTLEVVEDWFTHFDDDSPRIFWLHGPPGIGKTAVAKSVASYAQQHGNGILAANFFFSVRIGDGCSDGKLLFPTIAHQLASFHPSLKTSIAAALRKDIVLPQGTIESQFHGLFEQPLLSYLQQSTIAREPDTPFVVVLDGLDECADHSMMKKILRKLVELAPQLHRRVKLFLTSRPEDYISSILRHQSKGCVRGYDFQHEERAHSSDDMRVYFCDTLNDISQRKRWGHPESWLSSDDLGRLVDRADGLFIYAATVVRFMEHSWKHPSKSMSIVLNDTDEVAKAKVLAPIDQLYRAILKNAVPPDEQDPVAFIRHIQCILINVVCESVLHSNEIPWALQVEPASELTAILQPLHSVLKISRTIEGDLVGPMGTLHRSFNEFIMDESRCDRKFAVTSHAMESFSIQLFTLLGEVPVHLDGEQLRFWHMAYKCFALLKHYVMQTVRHEASEGCMIRWPLRLSSIVTHFSETQLPSMLAQHPHLRAANTGSLVFITCGLYWEWKEGSSRLESNQSGKRHSSARPFLCCLNYFAEMEISLDWKRKSTASLCNYFISFHPVLHYKVYRQPTKNCLGKRNHDVAPSCQLASICIESGFPAVAQFLQELADVEPEESKKLDTGIMQKLFGWCSQCREKDEQ